MRKDFTVQPIEEDLPPISSNDTMYKRTVRSPFGDGKNGDGGRTRSNAGSASDAKSVPELSVQDITQEEFLPPLGQGGNLLLGGTLFQRAEDGTNVYYTYSMPCTDSQADAMKLRFEALSARAEELPEIMIYGGQKKTHGSNEIAFTFYVPDYHPVSLRELLNSKPEQIDGEALQYFVLKRLLNLLLRMHSIFGEQEKDAYLGTLSLDTVFLDGRNQLRILPVCANRPEEYPIDQTPSADVFAAVMLCLELLDNTPVNMQDGSGPARPDDPLLRDCLMPCPSMRPSDEQLYQYLGLSPEDFQFDVRVRCAPDAGSKGGRREAPQKGFFEKLKQKFFEEPQETANTYKLPKLTKRDDP